MEQYILFCKYPETSLQPSTRQVAVLSPQCKAGRRLGTPSVGFTSLILSFKKCLGFARAHLRYHAFPCPAGAHYARASQPVLCRLASYSQHSHLPDRQSPLIATQVDSICSYGGGMVRTSSNRTWPMHPSSSCRRCRCSSPPQVVSERPSSSRSMRHP